METNDMKIFEGDYERSVLRSQRVISLNYSVENGEAKDIIEDLNIISFSDDKETPVTFIIASPGGDVFAGLAIIHAIKEIQRKGFKVIGRVYGHAMSMAFIILQCCDERIMGQYDHLMCHGVTTGFIGDIKNVDAEQKLMKKFQEDFANLIAGRNTSFDDSKYRDPVYWADILIENTPKYYNSDEASEMGLIDRVED